MRKTTKRRTQKGKPRGPRKKKSGPRFSNKYPLTQCWKNALNKGNFIVSHGVVVQVPDRDYNYPPFGLRFRVGSYFYSILSQLKESNDPFFKSLLDYINGEQSVDVFIEGYTLETGRVCIQRELLVNDGSPYKTLVSNKFYSYKNVVRHLYYGEEIGRYVWVGEMLCPLESDQRVLPNFDSLQDFPSLC